MTLIAIFFLLIASAFFSGAETALTAASRPLMHQLATTGDKRAAMVNELRQHRERLLGALLVGNNIVNILASALATGALVAMFGEVGVAYATVAMTALVVIFGEILPKTYAFRNADRAARALAPLVVPVVFVLEPVTHVLNTVIRRGLLLFNVDFKAEDGFAASVEELRGAIELHAGEDIKAVRHERAMLHGVLDLSELQLGEAMIHRSHVVAFDADEPAEAIFEKVLASPHSRFPLWRENPDNIVGVLHTKDIFRAVRDAGGDARKVNIAQIATKPWFVPETTPLLDQLRAFRERREQFAVVVDEYGSLMGIVTLADILAEIVGDMPEARDTAGSAEPLPGVRPQADGSYLIQGSVTIRDLDRELNWNLPDEAATTLAGLVLHESRRIPEVGQAFIFHGFRFEIVRRQRHQITLIRVTPPGDRNRSRVRTQ
ncbi:MAG: HlyC/CorC family transporter [Alphaproteobacteria bacterium]|nr:HlyC/CorC family transporter [Alphaproteobacteria bacterium]MBM3950306.1 HlyC/CorC family transporter [Rhodospirillales bacterium]